MLLPPNFSLFGKSSRPYKGGGTEAQKETAEIVNE